MSSILKALRKLEEEKAALGEGGVDISRDILKRSARKQESNFFWPLLSTVLFLLLIGFGIFFLTSVRTSPVLLQETAATDPIPIPVQPPLKEILPAVPVMTQIERDIPPSAPVSVVPASEKTAIPPQLHAKVEPAALRSDGIPFLKLTGIAYRDNSVERMAIINDLPVMQGTAIEGAQLVEIHPDRVVLSWKGALFDLRIEKE